MRFAARILRRQPGWAGVAILTVALGIAANTTIFAVVSTVLLEPLPYRAPDRLVLLWNRTSSSDLERAPIAAPDVADYREQAELFEAFVFSSRGSEVALTGDGRPEQITLAAVTSNFFSMLGVNAVVGRTFRPGEGLIAPEVLQDSTITPPPSPLVLSHQLWQQRFGGDTAVIGQSLSINGNPGFVVGVLPDRFEFLVPPDAGILSDVAAWMPIRVELSRLRRADRLGDQDTDNSGAVVGRLRAGVTLQQARAEMDAIAARQPCWKTASGTFG
jgi:putative ABC transport system permease protein